MSAHLDANQPSPENGILFGTEGIWAMALGFSTACVFLSVDGAALVPPPQGAALSGPVLWPVLAMSCSALIALLLTPATCVRGANHKWSRKPGNRWARWVFGGLGIIMSGGLGWVLVIAIALTARIPS